MAHVPIGWVALPSLLILVLQSAPGEPCMWARPCQVQWVNRPLSPHMPVKKPQFSASFSISHRIFGLALGTAIMLPPLAYKFSLRFDVWKLVLIWTTIGLGNYLDLLEPELWRFISSVIIYFSCLEFDGYGNKRQLFELLLYSSCV
jgi:succinate dehydrogenase (ubiquinone) cytochrome b560 subunit